MFRPNISCYIQKTSGKTDVYGMPVLGAKVVERCAIVQLKIKSEKSSVRADTSATRGNARELEVDANILLTKTTSANIDDMIIIGGGEYRIASKFPRYNLQGTLDHYEVTCTFWSA